MSCYNVKVIHYRYGTQVRIYSDLIGNNKNDFALNNNPLKEDRNDNNDDDELWQLYDNGFLKCSPDSITYIDGNIADKDNNDNKLNFDNGVKDKERSLYSSKNRTINSIYDIARSNEWEYFLTLTFNPDKVDSFNYEEVTKKLSKWLNNFKSRYAPELKYIIVPELHKSGRFHFHGLISNIGSASFVDSGKKDKSGNVIYNLGNYNLGFSTVTIINDVRRVSSYIGKYITKDLCATTFNKKRYWCSKNLDKPEILEYVMEPSEIEDMILSVNERITFMKQVECVQYDLCTTYLEIEEENI